MDNIILIVGPTGVGKTSSSLETAKKIDGEIISADSMQIYKEMDIGTAKIMAFEMEDIPHHLIDIINPDEEFSVRDFDEMSDIAINDIISRSKTPIIVGGTGLYINSIIYDMDYNESDIDIALRKELWDFYEKNGEDELYNMLLKYDSEAKVEKQNIKRVIRAIEIAKNHGKVKAFSEMKFKNKYKINMFVLCKDRAILYEMINKRVDYMINNGLVEEVKELLAKGLSKECQSMKAIGYRQIISYLEGEYDLKTAVDIIKRDSRRYAKRQLTWFKRYENAIWIDVDSLDPKQVAEIIINESGLIDK
ncbi:tRNA (adenosine(37)-N6)-dimethylallyltransferase MiaA [Proteocatella sphenisci]|uniref:tRNA (adenosine(37)-N6)-dimethylallyltransferase MiaA n=1 Tax=Proteocatella sphenisci TaxID=181070 RepID=UPI00048B3582|nr:tRNA (adenosine(37)-N6)-dimethylallyltransferase MiaA [Proteocatella sphenisci]